MKTTIRRTATTSLLAVSLAMLMSLTGCVTLFFPPTPATTSTPTVENVPADLRPFYSQVLTWKRCERSFQCATVVAPMNWEDPSHASIDLALIRATATGQRMGSLLVNPGGPGASGYNFIRDSLYFAVDRKLNTHYDIVGFDPRGVNKSSAVSCYSDPSKMDGYVFDILPDKLGSDAWIADSAAQSTAFGKDCLKYTGELLGFVDTVSAARDLDLLRAVLGDEKLNYLGYSYGTFLGATYAGLYPENTGRLVLDGAVDPETTNFDVTKTQAIGFESAARAFLKDCISGRDCPFSGTVDDGMARIRAILDRLDQSPLRAKDGRLLGSSTMFTAIILPLYSADTWPYLTDLFKDVLAGKTDVAFELADAYFDRNRDGSYADNSTEAFIAINCLDYEAGNLSVEELRERAATMVKAAPTFGPQMSYGGNSCDNWPFSSTRVREAIRAPGSAPILVLGTTNDPATPYQWSVNLAAELDNGHLVTRTGEGHTAYNKSNSCVDSVVDDFFIKGTVPSRDPNC